MTGTDLFRKRTVLVLIAVGVAAMLGFLLVSAYGDRFERQRGYTPSATSRFATGFAALYRLVDLSGGTATLSASQTDRPAGLLVLTPNIGTKASQIAAALDGREGPTLIVLPKWSAVPQEFRPTRENRRTTLPLQAIAAIVRDLSPITVQQGESGALRYPSGLALAPFHIEGIVQSIHGDHLATLIESPGGRAVLAEVMGRNIYILADPDLLNNHGLARRQNARAAIALLAALDPDRPGHVAFDTMLPYGAGGRNVAQLMFEPPFAGVSLALLAAALLAGIATFNRFGPVRREPRALAFGKRALIENIVTLTRSANRTNEGGAAYADTIRDWAARRLSLPRALQGEALDAHLDGLNMTTPYAACAARLRDATTEAEMLDAARKLDDWRKEMKA